MVKTLTIILLLFLVALLAEGATHVYGREPDRIVAARAVVTIINPYSDASVWLRGCWWVPEDGQPPVLGPGEEQSWPVMEPITVSLFRIEPTSRPATTQPVTMAQRADFDGDADVDLEDLRAFSACMNGPNRPPKCP